MLKSMLIGLDGSTNAQTAMELGFQWARRFNALLVGIGIVDTPDICRPEAVPIGGAYFKRHADEARLEKARQQVEHFLEEFASRCMDAGIVAKLLEEEGPPYEQILLDAQRYDLILLGQHTHFEFARNHATNDTLWKVLKKTPRPVVVVPEKYDCSDAILIAYDGSLQAARALHAFEATGLAAEQRVHLVCAAGDVLEAGRHLEKAAEFLNIHGISATTHPVASSSSPADVILELTDKLSAELLVMGSHGQSALLEFFIGSVTRTVLHESKAPLFVFH